MTAGRKEALPFAVTVALAAVVDGVVDIVHETPETPATPGTRESGRAAVVALIAGCTGRGCTAGST